MQQTACMVATAFSTETTIIIALVPLVATSSNNNYCTSEKCGQCFIDNNVNGGLHSNIQL